MEVGTIATTAVLRDNVNGHGNIRTLHAELLKSPLNVLIIQCKINLTAIDHITRDNLHSFTPIGVILHLKKLERLRILVKRRITLYRNHSIYLLVKTPFDFKGRILKEMISQRDRARALIPGIDQARAGKNDLSSIWRYFQVIHLEREKLIFIREGEKSAGLVLDFTDNTDLHLTGAMLQAIRALTTPKDPEIGTGNKGQRQRIEALISDKHLDRRFHANKREEPHRRHNLQA